MIKTAVVEIGSIIATGLIIKSWVDRIIKIVTPAVKEAEKRALDGVIDRDDRKQVALTLINSLEISGHIKLNFFSRLILSKVIDIVATRLPNFTISQKIKQNELGKPIP